jgi:membrane fusion protein, adhesin transport system
MRSLEEIKAPIIIKSLAYTIIGLVVVFVIFLFLPWRQTVTGEGKMTIFSPMQRPQIISAQIDAQISLWHVNEGQIVKRGDLLLELDEVNPQYLDQNQLEKLKKQRMALFDKRAATERLVRSLEDQIKSLTVLRRAAVPNAELEIQQSQDRLIGSEQQFEAAKQNYKTAELNFERRKQLYERGLSSQRDFELAELALVKARSEWKAVEAELDIARRKVSIAGFDLSQVSAETSLKIQEAEANLAQSFEKLAKVNSDIYKLDIDIANLESRIDQRKVYAPVDGQVLRLSAFGQAEIIKAGSQLALIVPESSDQAVELFVSDYFAPLISVGRKVRIQFSGFPALQFSGWPSAAVGTFAGEIMAIDASGDQENKYRILVKPDQARISEGKDIPWPDSTVLRPGANATGWIILDEVPMWYELWRILNGFPPTVMESPKNIRERKL